MLGGPRHWANWATPLGAAHYLGPPPLPQPPGMNEGHQAGYAHWLVHLYSAGVRARQARVTVHVRGGTLSALHAYLLHRDWLTVADCGLESCVGIAENVDTHRCTTQAIIPTRRTFGPFYFSGMISIPVTAGQPWGIRALANHFDYYGGYWVMYARCHHCLLLPPAGARPCAWLGGPGPGCCHST